MNRKTELHLKNKKIKYSTEDEEGKSKRMINYKFPQPRKLTKLLKK